MSWKTYSIGCNGYYNINDEKQWDYHSEYYQQYVKKVEAQVTELWTKYGELFEIWFDGGIIPLELTMGDVTVQITHAAENWHLRDVAVY